MKRLILIILILLLATPLYAAKSMTVEVDASGNPLIIIEQSDCASPLISSKQLCRDMEDGKIYKLNLAGTGIEEVAGGGGGSWGSITGTLSDQTDLSSALSGKSDNGHGHAQLHDNTLDHSNSLDHSNVNDPSIDQKAALAGTSGTPSITNKFVTNDDSRNTDARTPTAHNQDASTINTGTFDGDRLPAMSATKKGGVPATGTPSGKYLRDDGTWQVAGSGSESEIIVVKSGDTANATTTLADATGLSFTSLGDKTYLIEGWLRVATSATTVGLKLGINGPASPTFACSLSVQGLSGAVTVSGVSGNAYNANTATASLPFTTDNLVMFYAMVKTGASGGTIIVRFAAETTGTVTIKDGSVLRYREI